VDDAAADGKDVGRDQRLRADDARQTGNHAACGVNDFKHDARERMYCIGRHH
jgi:hypothetical protein